MFESENKLRHIPFFEEIAALDDEQPAARSATAGLLVLRLLDSWFEDRLVGSTEDRIRSAVAAIEEMEQGSPAYAILHRIVDALRSARENIHPVITPLMAYARTLEYDARWALAVDVYQSVLAHVHPVEDADASVSAYLRLGQCYRNLNDVAHATQAYHSASAVAHATGDMVGVLRARIGEAQLAVVRGNIPEAERILDHTIEQAQGADMRDVRSRALHDRSTVAYFRRDFEFAIQLAYEALALSELPSERDRILGDLALSFVELGVYTAASDAYLILAATAQEQYTRWAAALNLMDVAAKTGVETTFELYRRELEHKALPPYMATAFELHVGSGYRRFGKEHKARQHLQRALSLAQQHGFNQYLFEAEEALLEINVPPPVSPTPANISLDTQEVAQAIRDLREAAGV